MDNQVLKNKIKLIKGDITKVTTDVIVNAANNSLMGGGGVDGAIHRAGGNEIFEQCLQIRKKQGGCKTGEAVITTAGKLKAKYVIHTVGPVWDGGENGEAELLSNCYRNSLTLAVEYRAKSISFPSISSGVYNYPKEDAARIALTETLTFLQNDDAINEVIFVCFDDETFEIYSKLLSYY